MIRILQVFDTMNLGGAQVFIMNIYRNLDKSKIQFDFLLNSDMNDYFIKEIQLLGGKVFFIPKYKIYNHFSYCKMIDIFFKQHKEYKIIHNHHYNLAKIVFNIAKKYNITTICHSHSTHSDVGIKGVLKSIYKNGLNNVTDYAFSCGKDAGIYLYGNERNFTVINNAIDTKKFVYNEKVRIKIKKELNLPQNAFILGHVGRFMKVKNHHFILEIFRDYYKINKNSYLIFIGDGELKQNIICKSKEYGIEKNIIFLGKKNNVNDYLQIFDIFLLPSLYEGLPITIIEAQAAGLISLISNTITDEVIVSDLIIKLPIDIGTNIWVDKIKENKIYKRKNTYETIKKSNYDIEDISNYLTDFYINVYLKK